MWCTSPHDNKFKFLNQYLCPNITRMLFSKKKTLKYRNQRTKLIEARANDLRVQPRTNVSIPGLVKVSGREQNSPEVWSYRCNRGVGGKWCTSKNLHACIFKQSSYWIFWGNGRHLWSKERIIILHWIFRIVHWNLLLHVFYSLFHNEWYNFVLIISQSLKHL